MGLPWVRLDANVGTHDKTLDLLSRRDGHRAFALYICSLAWSGGQGTDGVIPGWALAVNHGTRRLADMLVDVGLYQHIEAGAYEIRNWALRQELSITSEMKRELQSMGGRKSACRRNHGAECGCWARST
jgi:hypothetical protein